MSLTLLLAYGAIMISIYLFVRAIIGFNLEMREESTGAISEKSIRISLLWRISFPYIRFLGQVFSRSFPPLPARPSGGSETDLRLSKEHKDLNGFHIFIHKVRKKLTQSLIIAGKPLEITPDDILGAMALGGIIGFLVGFLAHLAINFLGIWLVCILLGTFFPIIWLRDRAQRRQKEIRKALPFWLDLLTLSVEAGLDFTAALQRIGEKLPRNAFGEEINLMLRDIRMGKTRKAAFRELANRIHLEELNSITSALIQADEIGTSLGQILRIQSEQMRVKRFQRAEKLAMQAPVKLLFPLVGFIFPTVFIIIFGPIILKYLA